MFIKINLSNLIRTRSLATSLMLAPGVNESLMLRSISDLTEVYPKDSCSYRVVFPFEVRLN